ncbi:DNA-binding helix-turn-helix protein [Enterococcus faecalis RP2S-4]|uniref:DNA-binding helix-turn-helix protein n=1 Tax=Enterococcus faecalis RP2S-4 TaxID=1244145 RepID=A0ABC9TI65_ENTFL|nr:DNA-binding helix-turn-helix protein [Enterococcus faecalis RP2S-4]
MEEVKIVQPLAERLQLLREEKEWTKTYVAKQLGLKNLGTYANWEYGTREPDSEMLSKIASLYNVSTDFLLGRTEERIHLNDEEKIGRNIISHFRLNTSDMNIEDIEELEEELIDFQDFLIKKAKEKKERNKKD